MRFVWHWPQLCYEIRFGLVAHAANCPAENCECIECAESCFLKEHKRSVFEDLLLNGVNNE